METPHVGSSAFHGEEVWGSNPTPRCGPPLQTTVNSRRGRGTTSSRSVSSSRSYDPGVTGDGVDRVFRLQVGSSLLGVSGP